MLRETRGEHLERPIIRGEGRVFFIAAAEIEWIDAQGNCVNLRWGGRKHLFREALGSLETKLDPRMFRRTHRSTIVNVESVRELRPGFHDVVLRDGTELRLSHRYRENLEKNFLLTL